MILLLHFVMIESGIICKNELYVLILNSGLGYIVGSETAKIFDNRWEWGLRVTPVLGAVAVLLILLVMVDPARGESENSHLKPTSYKEDVIYLWKK